MTDNPKFKLLPGGVPDTPMVEITQDLDLPPEVELVRPQEKYDPRVMADNSATRFRAVPKDRKQADLFLRRFFRNAALLRCPRCSSEEFRIMADDHDDQPLIMIVCRSRECGATWAPMRIQVAQMTQEILRQHGVWMPPS